MLRISKNTSLEFLQILISSFIEEVVFYTTSNGSLYLTDSFQETERNPKWTWSEIHIDEHTAQTIFNKFNREKAKDLLDEVDRSVVILLEAIRTLTNDPYADALTGEELQKLWSLKRNLERTSCDLDANAKYIVENVQGKVPCIKILRMAYPDLGLRELKEAVDKYW